MNDQNPKRRFVDLHTHSFCSDGSLAPEEVVDIAERKKLAAVALSDHDTTAGLAAATERARRYPDLHFVPGVEISAIFPAGTLHILGLGIDENAPALVELTAELREAREQRNPKILAKLREIGVNIDMEDVLACTAGSTAPLQRVVGRLHMAEALRRKGYVRDVFEAFARYLGDGAPGYVDKERTPPPRAIDAIHAAGGAAILAHPPLLQYENNAQLKRILREFIPAGLDGIECYHSDHTPQQTRLYLDLAREFDLLISGGSDFHGPAKPNVQLGKPKVPLSAISALRPPEGADFGFRI